MFHINPSTDAARPAEPSPSGRRGRRRLLAVLAVSGLAAAVAPSGPAVAAGIDQSVPRPTVAAAVACVDFDPIPDNTPMGNNFVRAAFTFHSLAPAGAGIVPFVNEGLDLLGAPVHGLQFDNAGLAVRVPSAADTVDLTIGVFHPPAVGIRAINAAGVVVDSVSVPADNILHSVTLDGAQDITRLRFTGGGNEAIVEEICTT